jgi:hypothetical protein
VANQPGERRAAVVVLQVEDHRLLVAVAGQEVRRLAGVLGADERGSPPAGVVAPARVLDLDHAGAEVAEHHRGVRAGEGAGQVDDDDVRERSRHGRPFDGGRTAGPAGTAVQRSG